MTTYLAVQSHLECKRIDVVLNSPQAFTALKLEPAQAMDLADQLYHAVGRLTLDPTEADRDCD